MSANSKQYMKEIAEQYYAGNFKLVADHLHDDVTWISHKMANVQLKSKKEVVDFLSNVPKGRFSFENTNFILDEKHVVVEGICRYINKDGKLIENFYCDIFTFQKGKIIRVSAYFI